MSGDLRDMHSSPTQILAVDDVAGNLLSLSVVIEPLGHTLVQAMSGPDALREASTGTSPSFCST